MARDWHELFKTWSKPPSDTEEAKGKQAADMIRDAIRSSSALKDRNIDVVATGSYRNNTNVRLGSDIDVAIVLRDTFYFDLPEGVTRNDMGFGPASCHYPDFRSDVHRALVAKFGNDAVAPQNKTFEIRENSNRLNADATAFFEHRRYRKRKDGSIYPIKGSELRPHNDPNRRVINWHEQHYDAGVAKNKATGRRYKRVVRILKRLSADMVNNGTAQARSSANAVPSFLLECLAHNAPDDKFNLVEGSYYEDVNAVVGWLWHRTKPDDADGDKFTEVSGLKWLFGRHQPWTKAQAHDFVVQAWNHVGFKG